VTLVRVLPDITGLDKHFDYLVPDRFRDLVELGSLVRIPLHGRRVRGWVLEVDPVADVEASALRQITGVTGCGPTAEIIELATWAAWRWAGRRRQFLTVASPRHAIRFIPNSQRTGRAPQPSSPATTALLDSLDPGAGRHGGVLRLPPSADLLPTIASAVAQGPTLAVVPGVDQAMLLAARLRRSGLSVALAPDDWATAAGGTDVVIGARTAAWAPCPGLAVAVVLDEHDEALQAEASPTWHARDVVIDRCRRAGARFVLVSPAPTLTALEIADPVHPPAEREHAAWPEVNVVDRSDQEPWKRSLITSELIEYLRTPGCRVVCVSNTTGRARLLACRACRALATCERCEAAVHLDEEGRLACRRCQTVRAPVCSACRASSFANLRPGVTRLREELEAAAGRPVSQVTAAETDSLFSTAEIHVGTEAVLHRVAAADVVVFMDFDRELLAPRYRAAEQAMGLLVRAARLVGSRQRGGRLLIQTFSPDHEVVQAAVRGNPGLLAGQDRQRRQLLGLPPFQALAEISGPGAEAFVRSLAGVQLGGAAGEYLVRAPTMDLLADALGAGVRPPGAALRVAVDPPRL
jgi:primosomal protein N' (replication factor Y)